MDAQYFIDKFEAIPEEKWCTHALQEIDNSRCALGHCISKELDKYPGKKVMGGSDIEQNPEVRALTQLFDRHNLIVVYVNDRAGTLWNGSLYFDHNPYAIISHPKQRILAALRDIQIKEQQEAAIKEAEQLTQIPICSECGKPVTLCDCEDEEEFDEEEEDWAAGETLKNQVLDELLEVLTPA